MIPIRNEYDIPIPINLALNTSVTVTVFCLTPVHTLPKARKPTLRISGTPPHE